ncbi:MAG: glycerol kinase GlpK [Terracidiphilus sp.]
MILAIDQGTTNTKALLMDRSGSPIFRVSSSLPIVTTPEGFVEQDPIAIWNSVCTVSAAADQYANSIGARLEAVAISNQRETAIAWSRSTGEPLASAIGWQCGRSAGLCARLAPEADLVRASTGLPLAPLISAGKWAWLIENNSAVQSAVLNSDLCFGTVDSWLVHKLSGAHKHVTDLTNASRTGLLNIATLEWDRDLLQLFRIPAAAMPEQKATVGKFGKCDRLPALGNVPILAVAGDSHAAMFGHGHFAPGSVKATYGTGSSLMALTSELLPDTASLARTIAWSVKGRTQYALEGNIAMTGSAVQWLGEFLNLSDPVGDIAHLAASVESAAGVYFVPAMTGLGAPYWDAKARGSITGLARHHAAAHLARASLDAIAFQVADVFLAMQSAAGIGFAELLVDGGATKNSALMQFQADILGCPVLRSQNEELSAIGAAWFAGLELGWWKTLSELESLAGDVDRFEPRMKESERQTLYEGWREAVASVRGIGSVR